MHSIWRYISRFLRLHLVLKVYGSILKSMILKHIFLLVFDHFLWNFPHVNTTGSHYVNNGPTNGSWPSGNKPFCYYLNQCEHGHSILIQIVPRNIGATHKTYDIETKSLSMWYYSFHIFCEIQKPFGWYMLMMHLWMKLPSTKPSPQLMLTYHQWGLVALTWW